MPPSVGASRQTVPRIRAALTILAVAALGVWTIWGGEGLRVATDITEFLPAGEDPALGTLSRELTRSDLNRTITLTIEGMPLSRVTEATRAVAERLRDSPRVAWVREGADPGLQQAFYEIYYPHRRGFAPDFDGGEEAFRSRARTLRERLASPTGTFVREIATADPLGLFLEQMERLQRAGDGGLQLRDGVFVGGAGVAEEDAPAFGVILMASVASPFDGAASRELLQEIDEALSTWLAENEGPPLVLSQGGIHPIAVASETAIRADITRVSAIGTLGVIFIILLFFRSPLLLAVGGLPIAGGLVMGLACTRWFFGSVHGLTLAFGATLIGVALDYVVHLMNHHTLSPPETQHGPHGSLRRVAPGLVLGAATTVAGLIGLAWTSFPGIRQMAVFTTTGVAFALVLTMILVPPFLPSAPKPAPFYERLGERAARLLRFLGNRSSLLWAGVIVALLLGATGLPQLRWQDDIRALSPIDPVLQEEDERVRARVARMESGRLVFVRGASMEEALRRNDEVAQALSEGRLQGELDGFRTLSDFLPSEQTQRMRAEAFSLAAHPAFFADVMAAYEAEGFVAGAFEPFRQALNVPFVPLDAATYEASPLAALTASHRIETEDGVLLLTFLRGVADGEALGTRIDAIEGARYFDQTEYMAGAYREFRLRTIELVSVGLLMVFLLVWVRYRHLGRALAAFLPATLAAAATLGIYGWLNLEVNLLHVVCLLLVLSMGVDYGVFMVEANAGADGGVTLVGLFIACCSTFASFGVLAMSTNPALRSMGMTAALGVLLSLLLAPSAWLLLARKKSVSEPVDAPD